MSKSLQKPTTLDAEIVARSRLSTVENMDLEFSNSVWRAYERMRPANREAVAAVPIVDDHLTLIRGYAVRAESCELGSSKGLVNPGESVFEAANRELREEVGFGASDLAFSRRLSVVPPCFSGKMNIVVAQDLHPESLEGDEPEPLPQACRPLVHIMGLLETPNFNEVRNASALFLVRKWLKGQG